MARSINRPGLATVAIAFCVIVVGAPGYPANALSCAEHPEGSPTAIVQGQEELASGNSFFEHYDYAITGTVREIRTNDDGESDNYGFTQLQVAVINGYGIETVLDVVTISEPDPGWLQGYEFTSGSTYFIPVVVTDGPDGVRHASNVCDPITQLTVAEAEQLALQAADNVIVSAPADEVVPEPAPPTTLGPGSTNSAPAASTTVGTTSLSPAVLDDMLASAPVDTEPDDGINASLIVAAVGGAIALASFVAIWLRRHRR